MRLARKRMLGSEMGDGGRKAGAEWDGGGHGKEARSKKQEAVLLFSLAKRQEEWST